MEEKSAQLTRVIFLHDAKFVSVKQPDGITLYSTAELLDDDPGPSNKPCGSINILDANIVERHLNSHIIIVISKSEPKVMQAFHLGRKATLCVDRYKEPILSVKMNQERIAVCTENSLQIYNTSEVQLIHSILNTPENRWGLMDLATAESRSLVAYPGSANSGTVNIFDATNLSVINSFPAHNGILAALKFNSNGTMLATASGKGTVIRVFSIPDGQKLFEFRRGVTRYVHILSLAFSEDSKYLCSSSNTESVHVFKLDAPSSESSTWFSYFTQVAASYLPDEVNEFVSSGRSFAIARLPENEMPSVAAITTVKGEPCVLVGTRDGSLYCFSIDSRGGNCSLVKKKKIGPNIDRKGSNSTLEN